MSFVIPLTIIAQRIHKEVSKEPKENLINSSLFREPYEY